jgi:hypothetical protein
VAGTDLYLMYEPSLSTLLASVIGNFNVFFFMVLYMQDMNTLFTSKLLRTFLI